MLPDNTLPAPTSRPIARIPSSSGLPPARSQRFITVRGGTVVIEPTWSSAAESRSTMPSATGREDSVFARKGSTAMRSAPGLTSPLSSRGANSQRPVPSMTKSSAITSH